MNKALWTSSYVVFTSGIALCFLGFCYYLLDIKNNTKWTKPFLIFGMNALALYFLAELTGKILDLIPMTNANGELTSLQSWIFNTFFAPLAAPMTASLLYAICYALLWLFWMWLLYRSGFYQGLTIEMMWDEIEFAQCQGNGKRDKKVAVLPSRPLIYWACFNL